jgi:hypothetical protein
MEESIISSVAVFVAVSVSASNPVAGDAGSGLTASPILTVLTFSRLVVS